MKTFSLLLILFAGILVPDVSAQCNNKLVEQAVAISGNEAIVMREFKIKLEEGTMDKPMPVGRYNVFLNEGMHYRVVLANSALSEGKGVVQVYDKTDILGSTYDTETNEDHQQFDFVCGKSRTYQVLAFFREGKPGCMAAVLSMIMPDSVKQDTEVEPPHDILYIGIDNPLSISSNRTKYDALHLRINQGSIAGSSGEYIARVNREGLAVVYVDVLDNGGDTIETDSAIFEVRPLPLPVLLIADKQGGILSRQDITDAQYIGLRIPGIEAGDYYTIVEYSLVTDRKDNMTIPVNGNQFLQRHKDTLLKFPAGKEFYIMHAIVKAPDGVTYSLPSQSFLMEW